MTTYNCEICFQDKRLGEMTLCGNGHFGGCQKCHMELIKAKYKSSLYVFDVKKEDSNVQCCMFCREDLADYQMGEDWALKLHRLQPIMMFNNASKAGLLGERSLLDALDNYNKVFKKPEPFKYDVFEELLDKHSSLTEKDICIKVAEFALETSY